MEGGREDRTKGGRAGGTKSGEDEREKETEGAKA